MVTPVGSGVAGQTATNQVLECSDGPFRLSVGLAVTHRYPMVCYPQGGTQPVQAPLELQTIIGPDVPWLAPECHDAIVEKVGGPPAM